MTSGRLRIRDFAGLCFPVDQRYRTRQVGVEAGTAPSIANPFVFVGRGALVCSERVKPLENEPAGVAEELMQTDHPQQ